ncbi:MAG: hypothetical protein HON32_07420 [Francisellaceae bacterium]|nr:hypothetical protein [Francisellaceae bacterium]
MIKNRTIGGILLMSCTAIGGGVLALPTSTVSGGFYPTTILFIVCWFFMMLSAGYLLEVNLWFKKETNIISMAEKTIGPIGMLVAWASYVLLLTALLAAYLTGTSAWLQKLCAEYLQMDLNNHVALCAITIILATTIYLGTQALDHVNRVFSIILFTSFTMLIYKSYEYVDLKLLQDGSFKPLLSNMPLFITSFGSAIVIPTLVTYLDHDRKNLVKVLIIGCTLPLIMYIIWEWVTLGILSIPGSFGLEELSTKNANGTEVASSLATITNSPAINILAKSFAISTILTSIFGVSISLYHFLSDGLSIKTKGRPAILLLLITFCPSLLLVIFFPTSFDKILNVGGIIVSVLLGLLPITMVWGGRYVNGYGANARFKVPGGKPLLVIASLFFFAVIIVRLFIK